MLFSYNWLKEHIQGAFPTPDKLEELLNMHIFEVEEKEQNKDDWIFDISVLPHRGDAVGHYGLARDIAALLGRDMKKLSVKPLVKEKGSIAPVIIKVQSSAVSRYSAVVLEGVRIEQSPQWLKDRLASLGINSINNVVDVTNYIMTELGQPLHAFDYDSLKEHNMLVREAKEGEHMETLDDLTFKLPQGTLVIEDKGRIIDLAGMKGGKLSGIQQKTKNIVLQAATFSGKRIYQTKKKLGYTTQAADLYTHELDPEGTIHALERALELLSKMGGVKIAQVIDIYPKKRVVRKLTLNVDLLERYLGVVIAKPTVQKILEALGCKVQSQKTGFSVTVPTFRQDLVIEQDLIEEVARMYGYEKIVPVFPVAALTPSAENPIIRLRERVQDAFVEAGYTEIYNYSFIGEKDLRTFGYTKEDKDALVRMQNPFSEEYKYLRPNLIENLLKVVEENRNRVVDKDLLLFEVGKAFEKKERKIQEWDLASGVLSLSHNNDQEAFARAKGMIDTLLSRLGITQGVFDGFKQMPLHTRGSLWHPEKAAEIQIGGKKIGFLGILSPQIVSNLKLTGSCVVFSLDIETLLSELSDERIYDPIPRFPAVYRDLAVLVPLDAKVAEVMNRIHAEKSELIDDVDLFDMYEGEGVPEGKKNLAFHIIYQSREKTLTAKEVDELHKAIITRLETNPMWEVRT